MRKAVLYLSLLSFLPLLAADSAAVGVETADPADPVAGDLVASPDVDAVSLSNAVVIASAAARAAEEVRVAAAAQERAEAEASLARRRISTRTFHLAHASAEDVAAKLNSTWSGDLRLRRRLEDKQDGDCVPRVECRDGHSPCDDP